MPSIAVIGASSDRSKFGNICVRAYASNGFDVYPVNPKEDLIENHTVYRSVSEIPAKLDRVSIYLPPGRAWTVLDELANLDIGEVWLNPGVDTPGVISKANDLGINVVVGCSIVDIGLNPGSFSVK
jgi:predicted CoA-binding protein